MRRNPPIDFGQIDLESKYSEFNRKYFETALPPAEKLKFRFVKRKGVTAVAGAKLLPHPNHIIMKRVNGKVDPALVVDPYIEVNTRFKYDESEFDKCFLHEMCHIALMTQGYAFEGHGSRFIALTKEIGSRAGIEIPLTHDTAGAEVDDREKRVGFIILRNSDGSPFAYAMFSPTEANISAVRKFADARAHGGRTVEIHVALTKFWAHDTVFRKVGSSLQMRYAKGVDTLAALAPLTPNSAAYRITS